MQPYQLYGFGESGNAYKVALLLELAGCDWRLEFVDFFNGAARGTAFKDINAMGEIPVLRHGQKVLSQSALIQDYIIEQTGQFAAQNKDEQREIWRWVLWDNQKLSGYAGPARFLNNFIPKAKMPQGAYAWLQGRLKNSYRVLEHHFSDGRDWILAQHPSAADFSACGYLFYEEPFGFARADYPHIDRWLKRIANLPRWKHPYDLMERAFKGL